MSCARRLRQWSSSQRSGALWDPGSRWAVWVRSVAGSAAVGMSQCRARQAAWVFAVARRSRCCASEWAHLLCWSLGRVACRLGSVRDGNSHDKLQQAAQQMFGWLLPCIPPSHVPSGNNPFSPLSVFFPKNQPSPKSSSRSISSMRSPRLRLSSSGLRAINSSAVVCQQCCCSAAPRP